MAGKNLLQLDGTSQDFRMVKIMFFFYKCEFPNCTWETNETITECLDQPTVLVCFRPLNLSLRQSQKISDTVGELK